MEQQGIIRLIDGLGRVTIPIEYRRIYDLMPGDTAEIIGLDDGVLIAPHRPGCVFCKNREGVNEHLGQFVCGKCIQHFKRLGTGFIQL